MNTVCNESTQLGMGLLRKWSAMNVLRNERVSHKCGLL